MNKNMSPCSWGGGILGQGEPRLLWKVPPDSASLPVTGPSPQAHKTEADLQGNLLCWPLQANRHRLGSRCQAAGLCRWELPQGGAGTWAQGSVAVQAGACGLAATNQHVQRCPLALPRHWVRKGISGSEAWNLRSRGSPREAPPAMPARASPPAPAMPPCPIRGVPVGAARKRNFPFLFDLSPNIREAKLRVTPKDDE